MNPKVDEFISKAPKWQKELEQLRRIVLDCQLTEEIKWGKPCYTLQGSNIVLIHGFKEYCALLFIKGALINDIHGIMIQQTENVQAGRQIRFTDVQQIIDQEAFLKEYIMEAIQNERSGLEVQFKKETEYAVPEELRLKFEEDPAFKAAFEALTPGRQRGYLLYFSEPKQAKTRESRINKYIPHIFNKKGLND